MALSQSLLDELWDFSDPVASEARLRDAAANESDAAARAELLTQVARALGLQERYADGDEVLDGIDTGDSAVDVRVALERGRLRNSAGDPAAAVPLFERAAQAAASARLVFLQVDALHMLAIADTARAGEWTTAALAVLDGVDDPRTLRWRVGLHNNAGWALFDAGRFGDAVAAFEASRDAALRFGTAQQVEWADEAIADARAAAGPQA